MPSAFAKLLSRRVQESGRAQKEIALSVHEVADKKTKADTVEQKLSKLLSGNDDDAVRFFEDPDRLEALRNELGLSEEDYAELRAAPTLFVDEEIDDAARAFLMEQGARSAARFHVEIVPSERGKLLDAMKGWADPRLYVRQREPDAELRGALQALGVSFARLLADGDTSITRMWTLEGGPSLFLQPDLLPGPTADEEGWPYFRRPDIERERIDGRRGMWSARAEVVHEALVLKARHGYVPLRAEDALDGVARVCRRPDVVLTRRLVDGLWPSSEAPAFVWRHDGRFLSIGVAQSVARRVAPEMDILPVDERLAEICGEVRAKLATTNPFHLDGLWAKLMEKLANELGSVPIEAPRVIENCSPKEVFRLPEQKPEVPDFDCASIRAAVRATLERPSVATARVLLALRECDEAKAVRGSSADRADPLQRESATFHIGGGHLLHVVTWRFANTEAAHGQFRDPSSPGGWLLDFGDVALHLRFDHVPFLEGTLPFGGAHRRAAERRRAEDDDD